VQVRPIDVPTRFRDFDDYWTPFLGGQAPAPGYAMSLSEDRRTELREYLRTQLPYDADGSIPLIARAWAVRGGRQSGWPHRPSDGSPPTSAPPGLLQLSTIMLARAAGNSAWDPSGTTRGTRSYTTCTAGVVCIQHTARLTCANVYLDLLGVKGSQVQILSSRRRDRAVS
jgi:hypothetical protein